MAVLNFDPNRPPSRWEGWSANTKVRTIIILVVVTLVLARVLTMGVAVEHYWRGVARWLGFDVVQRADPVAANAKLKAGDIQRAFGNSENYPDDARDRGEEGRTVATLAVTASGRISGCKVLSSSGSASLDSATCRVARRVIRFEPARNGTGEPISSTFTLRVLWQLPDG